MEINVKKLERQRKGALKFFNSANYSVGNRNYNGILHYETAVGKTFTAQIIIKTMLEKNPIHNIVVLVPSEVLIKQWENRNAAFFTKAMLNNITVKSAGQMLSSPYHIETDLLVIDELHEFYTEARYEIINPIGGQIRFKQCLGLTATVYHPKGLHKKVLKWLPVIDRIDQEEAVREGYMSKFIEYNISVELTEDENADYDYYTDKIKKYMSKFDKHGFGLAQKVLNGGTDESGKEFKGFAYAVGWAKHKGFHNNLNMSIPEERDIYLEWNPNSIIGYAKELMKAVRERTGLLYNCENKLHVTSDIIAKFPHLKAICFGQSTNFADDLYVELNRVAPNSAVVYHSKLETIMMPSPKTGKLIKMGKTRLKRAALEALETGTSKVICTASSLDKGFDVKDISLAVTCAGTQNPIQNQQRTGRAKRLEEIYQTDTPVLLVNLYVPNSKDEDWLKKRQSKYKHIVHWIEDVNEITYNPKKNFEFLENQI